MERTLKKVGGEMDKSEAFYPRSVATIRNAVYSLGFKTGNLYKAQDERRGIN
jgi:hypothetical protein